MRKEQKNICDKFGSKFVDSLASSKVGISENVKLGEFPVHGLRHPQEGDTTGWYIWAGEYSEDPNFFKSLHVEHLNNWNPMIVKYLGLAPGWRFLIAPDHEDVWQDLSLLGI